jgi:hypothetical protein
MRPLWQAIKNRLNKDLPDWQARVGDPNEFGQIQAFERRLKDGDQWSDAEVLEALVRAVLSNSTDWAVITKRLPALKDEMNGFDFQRFVRLTDRDIENFYQWFKQNKAASPTLRRGLLRLHQAAGRLAKQDKNLGDYLQDLRNQRDDPEQMAVALGGTDETHKLPGLGIPLAAEFLKNVGFDLSKPDRHICRAVGSFGLFDFKNWKTRKDYGAPTPSEKEMVEVMGKIKSLASQAEISTILADNAIWLLCAKSGLHLTNKDLAELAQQ